MKGLLSLMRRLKVPLGSNDLMKLEMHWLCRHCRECGVNAAITSLSPPRCSQNERAC